MRKLKTTLNITYSNLLIGGKSTSVSFSLASVKNSNLLEKHLDKSEVNRSLLYSHSLKLQIPNSVFKLNLASKEIIVERWWYDKIKSTFFIDEIIAKNLNINPLLFKNVVKLYLSNDA